MTYTGNITDHELWIEDYQFFVTAHISYELTVTAATHTNPSEEDVSNEVLDIQELKVNDIEEEMLVDITNNYKTSIPKHIREELINQLYPILYEAGER